MKRIGMETGKPSKFVEVAVEKLVPRSNQPRKIFDEEDLRALAQSIKENGVLQPLLVRRVDGVLELIAGERRLRASKMAGLKQVPCLIMNVSEHKAAICSLLENIQRRNLSLFEESEAIAELINEYGLTQEEAAQRLGMAQSTLANKLRLLQFSGEEREGILQYQLTERHARALLRIKDAKARQDLLKEVGEKQLTVARTEQLVEILLQGEQKKEHARPIVIVKDVRIFANTVKRALDTMRLAGIPAEQIRNESEDFLEYVIRIPKTSALRENSVK